MKILSDSAEGLNMTSAPDARKKRNQPAPIPCWEHCLHCEEIESSQYVTASPLRLGSVKSSLKFVLFFLASGAEVIFNPSAESESIFIQASASLHYQIL